MRQLYICCFISLWCTLNCAGYIKILYCFFGMYLWYICVCVKSVINICVLPILFDTLLGEGLCVYTVSCNRNKEDWIELYCFFFFPFLLGLILGWVFLFSVCLPVQRHPFLCDDSKSITASILILCIQLPHRPLEKPVFCPWSQFWSSELDFQGHRSCKYQIWFPEHNQ